MLLIIAPMCIILTKHGDLQIQNSRSLSAMPMNEINCSDMSRYFRICRQEILPSRLPAGQPKEHNVYDSERTAVGQAMRILVAWGELNVVDIPRAGGVTKALNSLRAIRTVLSVWCPKYQPSTIAIKTRALYRGKFLKQVIV